MKKTEACCHGVDLHTTPRDSLEKILPELFTNFFESNVAAMPSKTSQLLDACVPPPLLVSSPLPVKEVADNVVKLAYIMSWMCYANYTTYIYFLAQNAVVIARYAESNRVS